MKRAPGNRGFFVPVRTGPEGRTPEHEAHRTPGPARAGASPAGRGLAGGLPRSSGGGGGNTKHKR